MGILNLRGTFTAIVTPFKYDLTIDFEAYDRLLEFQIENGIDGIIVCGSTGESATLSSKEKAVLIERSVEKIAGRVLVIAGTGSNNTAETIKLTQFAKEVGADASLLVAPYYSKPSQDMLYQHYLAVSENVDIPQIIYNVPGRAAINILPDTQLQLAKDCSNIVATKEASGNLEQMMAIIQKAPEGFNLLSGDDAMSVAITAMGGSGVISVLSNYAPKKFGDAVRYALKGEFDKAVHLHYELFELMQLNFIETNPVPVKAALAMMGMIDENYRLPLIPMMPKNREILKKALRKAGYID